MAVPSGSLKIRPLARQLLRPLSKYNTSDITLLLHCLI